MRRALARLAQSGLRASAAQAEGLPQATRALSIGLMGALQRAGPATQWAPSKALHSSPSWAAAEQQFNTVCYPESDAEVGEAAPSFSLPGAGGRVLVPRRRVLDRWRSFSCWFCTHSTLVGCSRACLITEVQVH